MEIHSLLRQEEYKALRTITLNGSTLDIGGDRKSAYHGLIKGNHPLTILNLDPHSKPDIYHDLEKPLPLGNNSYNHVLMINVLEHIYHYRELLKEAVRVLKPGGTLVVVVPFLFPIHPSPEDFHRFTASTLRKELEGVNLKNIKIQTLGKGVFSARYLMIDRLMPKIVRFLGYYTCRYVALAADWIFVRLSGILGKKYQKEDYALGYCVEAIKE